MRRDQLPTGPDRAEGAPRGGRRRSSGARTNSPWRKEGRMDEDEGGAGSRSS